MFLETISYNRFTDLNFDANILSNWLEFNMTSSNVPDTKSRHVDFSPTKASRGQKIKLWARDCRD